MASKPTKRERKDDAKKRRLEEMRRRQRRARMRKLYTYSVVGLIIAALAGVVLFSRMSKSNARKDLARVAAAGGCDVPKGYPIEGSDHIAGPSQENQQGQKAVYKTDPPTSGNHWAAQQPPAPAPTGVLKQVIQDEQFVHNMEHGHVIISYKQGEVSDAIVKKLGVVVRSDPKWILLTPRQNKNTKLAITAWGVKQRCDNPTENVDKVVSAFVKRFRNQGRESAPGTPVFQDEPEPPAGAPAGAPDGSAPAGSTGTGPPGNTNAPNDGTPPLPPSSAPATSG